MKKGLRLSSLHLVNKELCSSTLRPDEEGIETTEAMGDLSIPDPQFHSET